MKTVTNFFMLTLSLCMTIGLILDAKGKPTSSSQRTTPTSSATTKASPTATTSTTSTNTKPTSPTIINSSKQAVSNLQFFNATNTPIASPTASLAPKAQLSIPTGATYLKGTANGVTETLPLQAGQSYTVASQGISWNILSKTAKPAAVINNSTQTVALIFYGIINGNLNTALNSTPINVAPKGTVSILTGTTSVKVIVNGAPVAQIQVTPGTSYTIQYANNTWTMTPSNVKGQAATTTKPTSPTIINSSKQAVSNLQFFNATNTPIASPTASLAPKAQLSIPTGATYLKGTANGVTETLPLQAGQSYTVASQGISWNILSKTAKPAAVINNSTQTVALIFYGIINGNLNTALNSTPINVAPKGTVSILTGTTSVKVIVNGAPVAQIQVTPGTSYTIQYANNTWTMTPSNLKSQAATPSATTTSSSTATISQSIGNDTNQMLWVYFYNGNITLLSSNLSVASIVTIPAQATSVSVTANNIVVIRPVSISSNTSYVIKDEQNVWTLTPTN